MKKVLCKKGTAVVEFALIFPMLLMLVFGIIEFGVLLFNQQVITNASREGCRAGIVSQVPCVSEATIKGIVDSYISSNLITFGAANGHTTDVEPEDTDTDGGDCDFGDLLRVKVIYEYGFLFVPSLFDGSIGLTIDLVGDTLMIHE